MQGELLGGGEVSLRKRDAMKHPETATKKEIKQMAARILDDQKNDPEPHKPTKKKRS